MSLLEELKRQQLSMAKRHLAALAQPMGANQANELAHPMRASDRMLRDEMSMFASTGLLKNVPMRVSLDAASGISVPKAAGMRNTASYRDFVERHGRAPGPMEMAMWGG